MRFFCRIFGIAIFLLLAGLMPAAEEKSTCIWPKLEVGKVGNFMESKTKYLKVRIVELVSVDMMLVGIDKSDAPCFLVRGLPTKNLADDTLIELKGDWKVTGTGPYMRSGSKQKKTYFIVEPLKKPTTPDKPKSTDKDPKEEFKSAIALTSKAPNTWGLKEAKKDAVFLADRDFVITELPKAMEGGTLLVRDPDSHSSWMQPGMLTTSKDVTVYVTFLWKWQGKAVVNDTTLAALAKEGWSEVKEEVETTFPQGEDWKLKTYKKDVKTGTVNLQLRGFTWPEKTLTLYILK